MSITTTTPIAEMTVETMLNELESMGEDRNEYKGMPKKHLGMLLSTKREAMQYKAQAEAAQTPSTSRGRAKAAAPKLTKKAKAVRRNLTSTRESKLMAACARLIEEPWLGNDEVASFVEANNDMPARLTGARNMLRALYQAGKLDPAYFMELHGVMNELES